MEATGHPLPIPPHGFVANALLPGRPADADTRAAKWRRTNPRAPAAEGLLSPPPGISPGLPQGNGKTWYAVPAPNLVASGETSINHLPAWPKTGSATAGQSQYPSGSRRSFRVAEPVGFQQISPWLGASQQENWVTDTCRQDAQPPQPTNTHVTAAPGPAWWSTGTLPPSPVEYCLPCYWPLWSQAPTIAGCRTIDVERPADAAYFPLDSLPKPPFAPTGTEYPPVSDPLCTGNGTLSHGHGSPPGQRSYQASTRGLEDPVPLGGIFPPKVDHLEGYLDTDSVSEEHHPPIDLHQAVLINHTAVLTQGYGSQLSQPYLSPVKQLDGENLVIAEPQGPAGWGGQRSVPVEVESGGSSADTTGQLLGCSSSSHAKGSGIRKKRARFDEGLRKETSNTRTMGACLRCHNQRVRCVPNKLDGKSPFAPCETCLSFRRDSKKTIHNLPCLRFKVTSMVIHRAGGLGLTTRFPYDMVMDVDVADCPDPAIYNIEITQGLCKTPMRLQVRRFSPKETDVLHRRYMDNGVPKKRDIAAFCLVDVEKAAREFYHYIDCHAIAGLAEAVKDSDEIVKDTFAAIALHLGSLSAAVKAEETGTGTQAKRSPDQLDFLHKIVRLWFAIRHETGSAWLCGKERLGMSPEFGPNVPLPGKILVPRMIVAQFDGIRHEKIYKRLALELLRTFHTFLTSCNKEAWFTVYLATFLLLHQVACASRDRYRYSKENSEGKQLYTRYGDLGPLTSFVEDLHHGAVILLAHWQYFKRCDLMNFNWDDISDSALMCLDPEQVEFLRRTADRLREKLGSIPATPAQGCWEHELFWISKMFVSEAPRESAWTPPEVFTRDKPSVGREVNGG